ncbi:hypothetical protein H4R27_001179 [Coemansia aciculifera]|nr:hypothetical protein H4R27_001179 [Coemansia aciculifera]
MDNPTRDQGNVPDISALSRIHDLEMALLLTPQVLSEKNHAISLHERTIATHEQTIATHEQTNATFRHAFIDQQLTIATHEQTITELRLMINNQAQEPVFYNQLFAIWIAPLDIPTVDAAHAADTPVVVAPAFDIPAVIDAPAVDIPAVAAQAAAAPIVDAQVVTTSVTAIPEIDAHVAAASATTPIAAACIKTKTVSPCLTETQKRKCTALTNESPEASMAPKRHRVGMRASNDNATASSSSITCHSSSERVTSERLLAVIKPCIFVDVDFVSGIYHQAHGCSLMPPSIKPKHFVKELNKMDGLEHWVPQLATTDSAGLAGPNFLRRRDLEPEALRQSVLQQLDLDEDLGAMVLGPRLCYALVAMCGIRVDQMMGPIISSMFSTVTGEDLHLLNVVTERGVRQMTAKSICRMVKKWVSNLINLLAKSSSMEQSLVAARDCYNFYKGQCSGGSHGDPGSLVAKGILTGNRLCSLLFLGIQEDYLRELYKRLAHIASKRTSNHTKECLEQLAMKLRVRPSSS